MNRYVQKAFVLAGLLALGVSPLVGDGINQSISSSQSYSATVEVPSTATCYQNGAAFHTYNWVYDPVAGKWVDHGSDGVMTNNGPLGQYTRLPGNPLNVSGTISAGTYSIALLTYGQGYAQIAITW